jgi:UDP:flavonoid glycosyltransferase YjiC (YdhE family)
VWSSPLLIKAHACHLCSVGTAWPYPLPWYLIPLAILFSFRTIWVFIRFGKLSPFAKKRKEAGFTTSLALFETDSPLVLKEYFMSTPELDWPAVIPDKYCAVGPILQAVESVGDEDPELATWLAQRPTVLIVLGSVYKTKGEFAAEMIQAICRILSTRSDIQILWKLQSLRVGPKDVQQALKGLVAEDQVRVVEWLEADPLAILQTGNVCCSVNHGGSNSYHEAMA